MPYKTDECWVCRLRTAVQSHHLRPLEWGGAKDGKQVNLCAKDHSLAHFEALHYLKTGEYQNPLPPGEEGQRLERIIRIIVDTKLKWDAGHSKDHRDQRRISQVQWDSLEELQRAHSLKRVLGFKSLERMIKACVWHVYAEQQRKGRL